MTECPRCHGPNDTDCIICEACTSVEAEMHTIYEDDGSDPIPLSRPLPEIPERNGDVANSPGNLGPASVLNSFRLPFATKDKP